MPGTEPYPKVKEPLPRVRRGDSVFRWQSGTWYPWWLCTLWLLLQVFPMNCRIGMLTVMDGSQQVEQSEVAILAEEWVSIQGHVDMHGLIGVCYTCIFQISWNK